MKKKNHLKKLALMGITVGSVIASQTPAQAESDGIVLAGHSGCGGGGKSGGCGGYTNRPSSGCGAPQPNSGKYWADNDNPAPTTPPSDSYMNQNYNRTTTTTPSTQSTPMDSRTLQNAPGTMDNNSWNTPAHPDNANQNAQGQWGRYLSQADEANQSGANAAESQLLSQLNEEGKAIFRGLDAEGKSLALKLAAQSCKGKNDCKGLGGCKTGDHDCAGKNGCKGKGGSAFGDKNTAVKVAAQKMAQKRAMMNQGAWNTPKTSGGYNGSRN